MGNKENISINKESKYGTAVQTTRNKNKNKINSNVCVEGRAIDGAIHLLSNGQRKKVDERLVVDVRPPSFPPLP